MPVEVAVARLCYTNTNDAVFPHICSRADDLGEEAYRRPAPVLRPWNYYWLRANHRPLI